MKARKVLEHLGGLLVVGLIALGFMARQAGYSMSDLPQLVGQNLSGVVTGWGGGDAKFSADYEFIAVDENNAPVTFADDLIKFAIDESVSPSDEASIRAAFENTAAASRFKFEYIGRTGFDATMTNLNQSPATIVVSYTAKGATDVFNNMPSDTVAVGYSVVQEDVRIRGAVVVSEPDAVHGESLERLIMHELGHVLGLGHAESATQVMGPHMQGSYPAEWGSGDLRALELLSRD
jgi:hypothetical protein